MNAQTGIMAIVVVPGKLHFWADQQQVAIPGWLREDQKEGLHQECEGCVVVSRLPQPRFEQQIISLPGKGGYSTRPPGTTSLLVIWVEVYVASVTRGTFCIKKTTQISNNQGE